MKLPGKRILSGTHFDRIKDDDVKIVLRNLMRIIEEAQLSQAKVINFNEISYISQNAAPTPEEGQTMIWKDADAAPGNPQAYVITTQDGATYTFASEELA